MSLIFSLLKSYCSIQLLDAYSPILDRSIIKQDFQHKYPTVIKLFNQDLDKAKVIYDNQMESLRKMQHKAPLNKNMPEVAGALKWSQQLKSRIEKPMMSFKYIDHP